MKGKKAPPKRPQPNYFVSGIVGAIHDIPLQATDLPQFTGIHWTETKVVDSPSFSTSDRNVIRNIMYGLAIHGSNGTLMGQFLNTTPMKTANIGFFLDGLGKALRDVDLIS